ncbi:MAG: hypothetical protein JSR60_04310 [Proteobacteria bacterium]|nr:hypothetical protein [Pseudomonadota bacterium]
MDIALLYRQYRAGDPTLDFAKTGQYKRFRLLVAFFLKQEHWSVDRLLASGLSQSEAEARMNAALALRHGA